MFEEVMADGKNVQLDKTVHLKESEKGETVYVLY